MSARILNDDELDLFMAFILWLANVYNARTNVRKCHNMWQCYNIVKYLEIHCNVTYEHVQLISVLIHSSVGKQFLCFHVENCLVTITSHILSSNMTTDGMAVHFCDPQFNGKFLSQALCKQLVSCLDSTKRLHLYVLSESKFVEIFLMNKYKIMIPK